LVKLGWVKQHLLQKSATGFQRGCYTTTYVCEPEVELAEVVGIKVEPSNIFDLVLGYFSSDAFMYYHLPQRQNEAINTIFRNLTKASYKFKSKHRDTNIVY